LPASTGTTPLITISNEIPVAAGEHPTRVNRRKLRKVALHHWSWTYLLATAVVQKEHRGISDPEQAWILGELIRYLEHPKSGAMELDDMGSGTLRATDKGAPDVVARWDALLRYSSLRLGRELGTDVVQVRSRKEAADPSVRAESLLQDLVTNGRLTGSIRIPDTVGAVHLVADLRAGQISCHVDLGAPREGRPTTRINWLVRQLKAAPDAVRVEVFTVNQRGAGATELLAAVREDPTVLIVDPKREIKSFRIALSAPMGSKRGRGRGAFIDSLVDLLDVFYGEVVQHLKAWSATPPRLRESSPEPSQPVELASTALSSQDGSEPAAPS
jgi:hypothetical protein